MLLTTTFQRLALPCCAVVVSTVAAASHSVTLPGYGSFVGTTVRQTLTSKALPVPVDAWLGIDYAAQPVGERRFARPGPPAAFEGTKNATAYGFACIQDPEELPYPQDEACLSMNVFRPKNMTWSEKAPVLIWIHGRDQGGFVQGSARSFDGAAFVANSREPLIAVTFNYRINSLGFIPHAVFERQGLLNLGLFDQELLFQFVQRYVSAWGGDPRRVTIAGRSAGAHSVGIHLFHNYNKTAGPSPLFSQAILQSGSVTARSFPNASYPLYQQQFSRLLSATGCGSVANSSDAVIFGCLRVAPIDSIQEMTGSQAGIHEQFYHIPTMTTNVRDEAKFYDPGRIPSNTEFLSFIHNLIPGLDPNDLLQLQALYPDPATTDANGPYAHSPIATQYDRISAALTDYMYVCAGQETAVRMSRAGVPVYKLHFATNNTFPAWRGIPHTADTKYTWAEPGGSGGVQCIPT
ncbi:hypothetical protein ACEQ8H_001319 [Pleosporales sp. CAS-2024a]